MDLGDTTLPISPDSLHAAQSGTAVTEEVFVQDEPLLIYNEPVTIQGAVTGIVQVAASLSEREQYLSTLRLILGIGTGFTILAAFAVGWWLAGTAIRPIHRITHTAQAIGARI